MVLHKKPVLVLVDLVAKVSQDALDQVWHEWEVKNCLVQDANCT